MNRDDIYYEALRTRDPRFDGKFFVAVKTTGIYCRPICPAKPKRENVEFYANPHEAENAGYRPCLRCRPESAPLSSVWIGKTAVVRRAMKAIHTQGPLALDENCFAESFGVTARHLRRLFIEEIGKTPKQLAFENRLNLARKLLVETALSASEVAFASGFRSIRRFNDAFKDRFKRPPQSVRRQKLAMKGGLRISLPYRPPFDFESLRKSYESHRIGDLEWFEAGKMFRVVSYAGKTGVVAIENHPMKNQLEVEIDFPDTSMIHTLISRVRILFDLDSDPIVIANALETDPGVKKLLRKNPGIRLHSGWDPFEIAIATILGQLVSVEAARLLVKNLIDLLGEESSHSRNGKFTKLFPSPERIAASDLQGLKTTQTRKKTLIEFSRAIAEKRILLDPTQDVDAFIERIRSIRGIGPWTADYMALKVLRHTDAFPSSDLILARALEIHPKEVLEKMHPWRGYAAALFWREYAQTLKKTKKKKGTS